MSIGTSASKVFGAVVRGSPPVPHRIRGEANLFFQQKLISRLPILAIINALNTAVIVAVSWSLVSHSVLLSWAAFALLSPISIFVMLFKWRGLPAPTASSGGMVSRFERLSMLYGIVWGSASIVLWSGDPVQSLVLVGTAYGMCAGCAGLMNSLLGITARFVVPCLLLTSAALIFSHTLVGYGLVVLGVSLGIGALVSCTEAFDTNVSQIRALHDAQQATRKLELGMQLLDVGLKFEMLDGHHLSSNRAYQDLSEGLGTFEVGGRHRGPNGRMVDVSVHHDDEIGKVYLLKDMTAEMQFIAKLQEERDLAEEAVAIKNRFLKGISAEILVPLSVINGFASIMSSDSAIQFSEKEFRGHADEIDRACKALRRTIDGLVNYAQASTLDHAEFAGTVEICHLGDILENAAMRCAREFGECSERISMIGSADLSIVGLDEKELTTILSEMMAFATEQQVGHEGRVTLRMSVLADKSIRLTVRDYGNGLTGEVLDQFFEPFQSQTIGGVERQSVKPDLGLVTSKLVASSLGLSLTYRSHVGRGSLGELIIPARFCAQSQGVQPEAETACRMRA